MTDTTTDDAALRFKIADLLQGMGPMTAADAAAWLKVSSRTAAKSMQKMAAKGHLDAERADSGWGTPVVYTFISRPPVSEPSKLSDARRAYLREYGRNRRAAAKSHGAPLTR